MISITNSAIVEKIKGTGRTFTLSIKVGTNTFTKVKSLRRSSIFASNQKLSVGEAVSAFIEAEINDCRESLQNYEVKPILNIDGYNIPLGIFKVQAPSQADGSGTQKITAYDRMSETSKYTYTSTGLTSAKSTFSRICSICGYTAVTSGLTDVSINDKLLNGMDCRKALGYVAGVFGKNCVVGTDGNFKMVGYSNVSESTCKISINSLDTLEFPSKVSTIDYFNAVVNESTIYKSGSGNSGVNIVNPLFNSTSQTANILSYLKSNVGSNGYYPAKFKQLNGDPRIEVGDVIKVEHKNIATGLVVSDYVPVMSLVLDYDGGVSVSIEAYPTESEFSMSLSDLMDFTNSSNNNKFENLEGEIGDLNNSFGDLNNSFDDLNGNFGDLNDSFDDLSGNFDDLSDKVNGFAGDILIAKGQADFATVRAEAVEELNDLVSNSLGLYRTEIKGVGGDIKYYFHNAEDISNSNYIVAFTDKGFSFTNNWNEDESKIVWHYGMNPAGNSIMNYLVANKISADLINAGVIKSLPGAPIETEFSLNTGLFTLDSKSKKERFGFGTNAYNNLMLQYNYSDSSKNNIKLGFYYKGNFYRDSAHTDLISPSTEYYYGDLPSSDFYQYASNRYSKMTNLNDVLKTYKGFIMHSSGVSAGYSVNSDGTVFLSDFTAHQNNLLGGMLGFLPNAASDPENRTPILKFYDYEKEDPDGDSHYTAIRKQSIVTKYFGAEKIAFYYGGRAVDLESLFTGASNEFDYLSDKIGVLEQEIAQLKTALNVKTLAVFVSANPSDAGSVSGSGSYILQDGSFVVGAESKSGTRYYISSVNLTYASDGYSQTFDQQTLINNRWLTNSNTSLGMPVDILSSRLGDTLNVTVNFGEPEKHNVTLIADPTNGGTVSGGGFYYPGDKARIVASPYEDYDFVGWYEQGKLLTSSPVMLTQAIYEDQTYTAKFEKKPEELTITEGVTKAVVCSTQNSVVYLKFIPQYTGTYKFESLDQSSLDPDGYVYDSNKSQLHSGTNTGGFSFDYNFTAGTTYYLGVKLYSGTGTVNVKVSYNGSSGGETPNPTFTLTTKVSPEGAGSISVSKPGPYEFEVIYLTATPNSGYKLVDWFIKQLDSGNEYYAESAINPITQAIVENTEVTAIFEKVTSGTTTIKVTTSGASSTDVAYINSRGTTEVNLTTGTSYTVAAASPNGTISKVELYMDGTYVDVVNNISADGKTFQLSAEVYDTTAGKTLEYKVYFTSSSSGGGTTGGTATFIVSKFSGATSYDSVWIERNNQSSGTSVSIPFGETINICANTIVGRQINEVMLYDDGVYAGSFTQSDLLTDGSLSTDKKTLYMPFDFDDPNYIGTTREFKIYFTTA